MTTLTAPPPDTVPERQSARRFVDMMLRARELSILAALVILVVTLGTLYVIQGLDYYWAHGEQINADVLPSGLLKLGNGSVLGIPYLPLITVVVMLMVGYYLRSYGSGREFYAIGSSPEAAR